ncbi:formylmethionine deformylase [Clostridium sp. W14A]|nr:formylmethionine deformylase [Clostridium sp. W14A]
MAVREILLLGNKALYTTCRKVSPDETEKAAQVIRDLRDTLDDFQRRYGYGRAVAAPQIGEPVRIICMNFGGHDLTFINPELDFSGETFELWDDCMSFPGLEVRLNRYRNCTVHFLDAQFRPHTLVCEGDLSELIQHEYDHLDGILAVQRALDSHSFRINPEKALLCRDKAVH